MTLLLGWEQSSGIQDWSTVTQDNWPLKTIRWTSLSHLTGQPVLLVRDNLVDNLLVLFWSVHSILYRQSEASGIINQVTSSTFLRFFPNHDIPPFFGQRSPRIKNYFRNFNTFRVHTCVQQKGVTPLKQNYKTDSLIYLMLKFYLTHPASFYPNTHIFSE